MNDIYDIIKMIDDNNMKLYLSGVKNGASYVMKNHNNIIPSVKPAYVATCGDTECGTSSINAAELLKSVLSTSYDRDVKKGDLFLHFKGGIYLIVATDVHDSETTSTMIVYRNILTGELWVRPESEFISNVDSEKYPDCTETYRFTKLIAKG